VSRRGGGRGNSLRRGSGGGGPAPFNPASVGTLVWWLRGDDVTLNGADVSSWNDKSGNGRHWTQGTAADQPLFVASAINGRPGVAFDGANTEFLNGPNINALGLTAAETFIVLRLVNDPAPVANEGLWRIGSVGASASRFLGTTGGINEDFGRATATVFLGDPTVSMTSPRIYSVVASASELTNYIDGVQLATTTNTVAWETAPWLGKSAAVGFNFYGTICEWFTYTAKLSAPNRATVIAYLKARYAIA